jgi:CBS domain-containing protein
VGPLASFVIAAFCYGLGRAVADVPWAFALTGYLAAVNLVLGLFNLVPGFPLDGGRLLRAMLWWWSGRPSWATRCASGVGAAFALALVGLGVVRVISGEAVGGVWFVLLGLFLYQAARASAEVARLRERLEQLAVADVMTPLGTAVEGLAPLGRDDAVASDSPAWTAYLALSRNGAPRIAVVDGGRLVGVVSHADLQSVLAADGLGAGVGRRAA